MARWWIPRCSSRRWSNRSRPRKSLPVDAPASMRGELRSRAEHEVLVGTGVAMAGGAGRTIGWRQECAAIAAEAREFPVAGALVSIRRAEALTLAHHIDAHDLALLQGARGIAQQLAFAILHRLRVLHDHDRTVGIGNLADILHCSGESVRVGGRDERVLVRKRDA